MMKMITKKRTKHRTQLMNCSVMVKYVSSNLGFCVKYSLRATKANVRRYETTGSMALVYQSSSIMPHFTISQVGSVLLTSRNNEAKKQKKKIKVNHTM
mmetsp:Transcript_66957/g.82016  ORF Transcript_66957/g.82016 Transcript_66957/m.82016 type:complete len:98 (+) Transcript_66957:87-380(+)